MHAAATSANAGIRMVRILLQSFLIFSSHISYSTPCSCRTACNFSIWIFTPLAPPALIPQTSATLPPAYLRLSRFPSFFFFAAPIPYMSPTLFP